MKFIFTLLFIIGFCSQIHAGFMDWECQTPGGNEINDFVGFVTLELQDHQKIEQLKSWYFYKNHIIGKLEKDKGFFIVNESTLQVINFNSEQEWKQYLNTQNLTPRIWTRWYQSDWTMLDEGMFWFFYGVPLLLIISFILYKAIKEERFNLKKPYTIVLLIFIIVIASRYVIEQFPQSF